MNRFWFWFSLTALNISIGINLFFVTPLFNAFAIFLCALALGIYIYIASE